MNKTYSGYYILVIKKEGAIELPAGSYIELHELKDHYQVLVKEEMVEVVADYTVAGNEVNLILEAV